MLGAFDADDVMHVVARIYGNRDSDCSLIVWLYPALRIVKQANER